MKKKILIFISLFFIIVLTGCGTENKNQVNLSDQGFLSKIGEWEREGNPSIKIKFNIDGKGKITTDGKKWLDMNWIYDEDILAIQSQLNSRELIADWIIKIDRKNTVLELIDTITETKMKYVKSGTQNIENKEYNKDEKLVGIWYKTIFDYDGDTLKLDIPIISLQNDNKRLSGKGKYEDKIVEIDHDKVFINWYTDEDKLILILYNGVIYEYTYEATDTTLKLYQDEKLINTYSKFDDNDKEIK